MGTANVDPAFSNAAAPALPARRDWLDITVRQSFQTGGMRTKYNECSLTTASRPKTMPWQSRNRR